MGGIGSGGHNKTHRSVEDYRKVDSFDLQRCMEQNTGRLWEVFDRGSIYCNLLASTVEISQNGVYRPLQLDKAGGSAGTPSRLYFRCPLCDRRTRYLYNYHGFHVCRKCLNANYIGQQRNRGLEAIRRKMKKLVECDLGYSCWRIDNPNLGISELVTIPKPLYMRWEKYDRLMLKYRELQEDYTREFLKICGAFLPPGWEQEFKKLI